MKYSSLKNWLKITQQHCVPSIPVIIVMHGFSGSGKSTVSGFLAEQYQAAWVRSDVERKWLFGLSEFESSYDHGINIYTPQATRKTFERMALIAQWLLSDQYPVIIDSGALKESERELFRKLAVQFNATYVIVNCMARTKTLKQRISNRLDLNNDASEANTDLIERQQSWIEPLTQEERSCHIPLNTENSSWPSHLKVQLSHKIKPFC